MARKKTITEFLEQAKSIHGEKYDYSKVVYESTQKPIEIICKIHGSFFQRPLDHLHGQNCPHCSHRSFRYTTEEFIELARKIHGGKYDYSKVEYINNQTKVCIICPKHGEFWQTPQHHLKGFGCKKCSITYNYTTKEFIEICQKLYGNRYDYSKTVYKNQKTKVCVICPKHGEFYTYPMHHMRGVGCPDCQNSILEEKTARELEKHKLEYIWHCRKEDLSWLGKQSLDFYLPKYKIAIECQGIQHFEPVKFFGGEKSFKYRVKLDENKLKLCSDNAVKMFYINYNDNLENKIKELVEICSG
jgi:hypothetical protein